jgi:ATP-binding cassette subfamily C (CFTR/MRP) protein 4
LKLEKGKFYGITGNIGSGKSSLLSVFLQELPYYSGTCQINGSLAFVEQEPILFSSSIKNNIVFDFPFKREKYNDILNRACLTRDLEIMEKGDET